MNLRAAVLFSCFLLLPIVGQGRPVQRAVDPAETAAVWQAAAMMGEGGWAEVYEISNTEPDARYPAKVRATIFAFDDLLWFYTPSEGTQSLSRFRGQVEADRENLGPLLREVHPGFTSFRAVSADNVAPATGVGETPVQRWSPLINGCFVESAHELLRLQASSVLLIEARVLFFYVRQGLAQKGHAVLVYATSGGYFGWDPAQPDKEVALPRFGEETSALSLARAFLPGALLTRLQKARFLNVRHLAYPTTRYALGSASRASVGVARR